MTKDRFMFNSGLQHHCKLDKASRIAWMLDYIYIALFHDTARNPVTKITRHKGILNTSYRCRVALRTEDKTRTVFSLTGVGRSFLKKLSIRCCRFDIQSAFVGWMDWARNETKDNNELSCKMRWKREMVLDIRHMSKVSRWEYLK